MVDASELLQIWERGFGLPPALALLPLLVAACPEIPPKQLPQLTIGERDGLLLTQREWMFGPQLEAVATCPQCGERLELSLMVSDLRAEPPIADDSRLRPKGLLTAVVGEYQVEFRAPTIADTQNGITLKQLLGRCIVSALRAGERQPAADLPPQVIEAISQAMEEADPQADIQLALECLACKYQWLAPFDIVPFFWEEIHTWAQRTLQEIHEIAGAYGWNEAEILALSPARRRYYLAMIGAS